MTKVDSKGRIVLPREVRERLGVTPGTEVEVREEDGRGIVEPEDEPERILKRMETIVGEIADEEPTPFGELDPQARDHVDTIRRQADQAASENDSE